MGTSLVFVAFFMIWGSTKMMRIVLTHRKEREILLHQEKLAMINRGMDPSGKVQQNIAELHAQNQKLLQRVETVESIVTSTDYELNKRFQLLIEREQKESYHQLEQISQAITNEFARTTTLSNRYRILEEIGRGGMGIVLKAQDTQLNEVVALKLITPQISADERVAGRFKQEAAASRKIAHPNVIRIHDLGEFEGTLYISMEYFLGESLKSVIKKRAPLGIDDVLNFALQICRGVQAAHEVGIVHRDLKPQNILINTGNHLKIIDFGLAKASFLQGLTMTGLVVGTPEYMSPEQISGHEVDQRTDVYAIGVIIFEMLTGNVPFSGETPISIGFKHLQETPSLPVGVNMTVPQWLEGIVMRSLAKKPEDRYASVAHIERDLIGRTCSAMV